MQAGFQHRFALVAVLAAVFVTGGCVHFVSEPISADSTATSFDHRTLDDELLHAFLRRNTGASVESWPVKTWDFEQLSWVAFYYHPSLELARAQWASGEAGRIAAASRPNPTVSLTPGFNSGAAAASPWFPAVNFDVPFETAGKRTRRMDQAQHAAESARQKVFVAAWQVRSDLRRALATWAQALHRSEALGRQVRLDERVMELTESRRVAGAASILEASATRLAWSRTQADAAAALRQVTLARHTVAQALGVPAAALDTLVISEALLTNPFKSNVDLAEARTVALRSRPDLLAALADYAATQSALQLEIARQYPDVHLGPGYQWDQGASKWSLALTLQLPLFDRNAGPIAEAKARRHESAARFIALQTKVAAEIDRAVAEFTSTQSQVVAAEIIAKGFERQHALQQTRLKVGDIDRLEYQIARRELDLAALAVIDARDGAALAAADLEGALQLPFPLLLTIASSPSEPLFSP
jgi:cobalt-zinc-cadmium efflux system outer membrane protein